MNIEVVSTQRADQFQSSKASDQVSGARKKAEDQASTEEVEKKQIQPEELIKQIKSLTDEGLYSVRFERDERSHGMVIKIVDQEKDEVIRQVPAEEVLEMRAALDNLRGNIIDTQS